MYECMYAPLYDCTDMHIHTIICRLAFACMSNALHIYTYILCRLTFACMSTAQRCTPYIHIHIHTCICRLPFACMSTAQRRATCIQIHTHTCICKLTFACPFGPPYDKQRTHTTHTYAYTYMHMHMQAHFRMYGPCTPYIHIHTHTCICRLTFACMATAPSDRPTMSEVHKMLMVIEKMCCEYVCMYVSGQDAHGH